VGAAHNRSGDLSSKDGIELVCVRLAVQEIPAKIASRAATQLSDDLIEIEQFDTVVGAKVLKYGIAHRPVKCTQ